MSQNNAKISIRLLPDGYSILGQKQSIAPGADFDQRLEESLLDQHVAEYEEGAECEVYTDRFSLSPAQTKESQAEQLYVLSTPRESCEEIVLHESDEESGVRITYGIHADLYHFLLRTLQQVSFTHPLLRLHRQWKEQQVSAYMVAETDDCGINLLVYREGQLLLANRIATDSKKNQCYHLLNAWTECDLDICQDKLYLIGASEELRDNISTFIKQCE